MKTMISKETASAVPLILILGTLSAMVLSPVQEAKLTAVDGAFNDVFGSAVAISGDTAVIGAELDDDTGLNSGSAYVFYRDGSGTWSQQAKLLPDGGTTFDLFGRSVAIDGDTAVIGARAHTFFGNAIPTVYVFVRTGTTWAKQAKLEPADVVLDDSFAISLAIDGDTIAVGAFGDDDEAENAGATYVFVRSGSTWSQQAKLTATDAAANDFFGFGVTVYGDTAVIGAFGDDDNGSSSGSAYVFTRSGTTWTQQAKLLPSDGAAFDSFGRRAVELDTDTVIIGAIGNDDAGNQSGSAYVFIRSGSTWSQQAKLLSADLAAGDNFANDVAIEGDIAVIGALGDDDDGSLSGSAYVFTRSGSTWTEQAKLTAADAAAGDQFGRYVCMDGNRVVLSAHRDDDHGTQSGSAYIFLLGPDDDEPPITTDVVATPNPVEINTGITLTAKIDDTATGGSVIVSADYTIDGGAGGGMGAQDGVFDEVTEDVTVAIPAFSEAGVHNLCVSGTDAAGNQGEEDCTFLAVYDPDGGFVTGGGWSNSPEGAYLQDPGLTGKANFGFVSKYQKGATVPTGNTEFQFKAGDLNFHSSNYDFLVVTMGGTNAQFKGSGTINGALAPNGNEYRFMIWAHDDSPDTFRIRIWYETDGDESDVYDNGFDQPIGGGSIVIHTN